MWKTIGGATKSSSPAGEVARRAEFSQEAEKGSVQAAVAGNARSSIGKGIKFVGQITATEPLFIDGTVEGEINLPTDRVTVGRNGSVTADIIARDIVVQGTVVGNLSATERVELRAEGSLTGDISTRRISIAEGAFFKGKLDVTLNQGNHGEVAAAKAELTAELASGEPEIPYVVLAQTDVRKRAMRHLLQSA